MKVTLIIPTFNEIDSIGKVLGEIPKNSADEVLVVDGRSTDGTPELVRKLCQITNLPNQKLKNS